MSSEKKNPVELEEKDLDIIEGELININQSRVRSIEGGHVEMQQVGALTIDGERVECTQGAAALLRGGTVSLNQSASALTSGNTTSLNLSVSTLTIAGREASASKSALGIVASKEVKMQNCTSLLVLANKVEGDFTTLLDARSALAAGAVIGGFLGLLALLRKR
jgi:hypothetical protein